MPIAQSTTSVSASLLAEFEVQAAITRRFLERLPENKLTWKLHERSMTAGQLAFHLASVPGGVAQAVLSNPGQARGFQFPQPESCDEILNALDESIATLRRVLPTLDDAAMEEMWKLNDADHEIFSQPRGEFLRNVMLSHWYQHRGQFSVYLRLLNIAVPASWGPSADEPPLFMQKAQAA